MSTSGLSTCLPMPAQSTCQCICHITIQTYNLYSHLPRQHCIDYIVIKKFPIWQNECNTISFSYNVCLIRFKLRWVCNDEAYTHVFFEAILRTLNFRPSWTHFGSWIHFESRLPTKTFCSSKRLLTCHQVQDRPTHLFSIFKFCLVHLSHQDKL